MFLSDFAAEDEENIKVEKIGVVSSGGGVSCAYSAGVHAALVEHYGFTNPDILIGASGSAPNVSCVAAGQLDVCIDNWLNKISQPEVVTYSRFERKVEINVDYIVDHLIANQLDMQALTRSTTEVLLATTEYSTGKTIYYSNHEVEGRGIAWKDVIRASMAIPIAYGKKVRFAEKDHVDGELSSPVEESIRLAIQRGATTIIAINNSKNRSVETFLPFREALADYNVVRALINRFRKMIFHPKLYPDRRIITVQPDRPLPTHLFNNHPAAIEKAFRQGYNDAINHPALNLFFNRQAQQLLKVS